MGVEVLPELAMEPGDLVARGGKEEVRTPEGGPHWGGVGLVDREPLVPPVPDGHLDVAGSGLHHWDGVHGGVGECHGLGLRVFRVSGLGFSVYGQGLGCYVFRV